VVAVLSSQLVLRLLLQLLMLQPVSLLLSLFFLAVSLLVVMLCWVAAASTRVASIVSGRHH
jgi:hypothetical protein